MNSKMKLFLYLPFIALSATASAAPSKIVGKCEVTISNDPTFTKDILLVDSPCLVGGSPMHFSFRNKERKPKTVQLNFNFGGPKRTLDVTWLDTDKNYQMKGETFTVAPVISNAATELVPGVPFNFTLGHKDMSPNPAIRLGCEIDEDAGPYSEPPNDCTGLGGGSSVSN